MIRIINQTSMHVLISSLLCRAALFPTNGRNTDIDKDTAFRNVRNYIIDKNGSEKYAAFG